MDKYITGVAVVVCIMGCALAAPAPADSHKGVVQGPSGFKGQLYAFFSAFDMTNILSGGWGAFNLYNFLIARQVFGEKSADSWPWAADITNWGTERIIAVIFGSIFTGMVVLKYICTIMYPKLT
eukprot:Nk52_evm26s233 gene=Nk52_evmTU26s233